MLAPKEGQDPFLFLIARLTLVLGQRLEHTLVMATLALHDALPLACRPWKRRQGVINNGDIVGIVQHTAVDIQYGEHACPEGDIGT
jgi:hypothetical protein